jgi:tryptophanyl-tRNA synthetase
MQKRILSGIKPTGRTHIGNYFGALKQWVYLMNSGDYECICMVADYHTLNFVQNAEQMRALTRDTILDFLAIGLDPEKVIIFKQSDISAHTELTWIFDTLVSVPFLMRSHAYKDALNKEEKKGLISIALEQKTDSVGSGISVGVLNYPVLMASDILLYSPDVVPVGADQKQHVEYARDIAGKFNNAFGETFKLPEEMIMKEVAVVPGIDGRKMSKSYGNTIPLFASDEEIEKAVMSIVTDSGADIPENVYAIHKLLKSESELKPIYEANKGKYKALKDILVADLKAFIAPMRDKRKVIEMDFELIGRVIMQGRSKAHAIADAKLSEVKKKIGVN